jgi:DNA primase catalytic core
MTEKDFSCDPGMIEWANSLARTAYCEQLRKNDEALEYLAQKRGFTMQTIQEFGIGYAPNSWNYVANKLRTEHNIPIEVLVASGLVIEIKEDGKSPRYCDRFRNRIMFPWEARGRNEEIVVGFTGRTLDPEEQAKYLNTPQTAIFQKGELLYSFERAIKSAVKTNELVIVEGPTDVMQAYQKGVCNFTAPCGTSLTAGHIALIQRRLPNGKVLLCFDSDEAGISATERALDNFLGFDARVAIPLISGDPDDVLRKYPVDYLIGRRVDGLEYLIELKMKNLGIEHLHGAADCVCLAQALSPAFSALAQNHPARFGAYVDKLAHKMRESGISRDSLLSCLEEKVHDRQMPAGILNDAHYAEMRFMQDLVYLALRGSLPSTLQYLNEHTTVKKDLTLPEAIAVFEYLEKIYLESGMQQNLNGINMPLFGGRAKIFVAEEIRQHAKNQSDGLANQGKETELNAYILRRLMDTSGILSPPKLNYLLEKAEMIHTNTHLMPALKTAVKKHVLDVVRKEVDGLTARIS